MSGTRGQVYDDLEKLKKLRKKVNWKVAEERIEFLEKIYPLLSDWKGQLPNLRNIFHPGEIERLLFDAVNFATLSVREKFIEFVARTGYRHDGRSVDEAGRPTSRRYTPVHCFRAAALSPIVRNLLIIYSRFDVNYRDDSGLTHMHVACMAKDCLDFVEKFLELGQDPNLLVEETGDSPLHFATTQHNNRAIELLLRRGADPNLANKNGSTPLHIVGKVHCIPDVIELLFEIGEEMHQRLRIDARDSSGNTPLHLAVRQMRDCGDWEVVEGLLRRGADPNVANAEGSTTLHLICRRNVLFFLTRMVVREDKIVEQYLKLIDAQRQTCQVDARDKLGWTPLQWAVANLLPSTVDVLLDRGADLSDFVFPGESHVGEQLKARKKESWFKFRLASGALGVVERLENRGYELDRSDALTIMKFFAKHELFDKTLDLEKRWYDDQEFVSRAKQWKIRPNLSFYDLIQLRPKEEAKQFTCADYFKIWCTDKFWMLGNKKACELYLIEKLSRRFFRKWALDSFMELIHYRLPILCCDMIIEQLANVDLYNICVAATGQKS